MNMNNSDNMMSLFDYLHRAAGDQLGLEVAKAAAVERIQVTTRYVETKTYKGNVNLYPKSFLDSYFNNGSIVEDSVHIGIDDDLPF